jgi:hypothetical protein
MTFDQSTSTQPTLTQDASTKIDKKWRESTQKRHKARTGNTSTDDEGWFNKYKDVNKE